MNRNFDGEKMQYNLPSGGFAWGEATLQRD
jgi:hypothetical protein